MTSSLALALTAGAGEFVSTLLVVPCRKVVLPASSAGNGFNVAPGVLGRVPWRAATIPRSWLQTRRGWRQFFQRAGPVACARHGRQRVGLLSRIGGLVDITVLGHGLDPAGMRIHPSPHAGDVRVPVVSEEMAAASRPPLRTATLLGGPAPAMHERPCRPYPRRSTRQARTHRVRRRAFRRGSENDDTVMVSMLPRLL